VEIPDTGILPIRKCIIKKKTDGVETRVSITIPYRSMPSPSMRSQRSICKHILLREYYNSFDIWCAIYFLFFFYLSWHALLFITSKYLHLEPTSLYLCHASDESLAWKKPHRAR